MDGEVVDQINASCQDEGFIPEGIRPNAELVATFLLGVPVLQRCLHVEEVDD